MANIIWPHFRLAFRYVACVLYGLYYILRSILLLSADLYKNLYQTKHYSNILYNTWKSTCSVWTQQQYDDQRHSNQTTIIILLFLIQITNRHAQVSRAIKPNIITSYRRVCALEFIVDAIICHYCSVQQYTCRSRSPDSPSHVPIYVYVW